MRSPTSPLSPETAAAARISRALLERYAAPDEPLILHIGDDAELLELPSEAVEMLRDILAAIASGERVSVLTEHAELSTFEAAAILNVSRPYLIRLLDEQQIPSHKVGTHRRVRLDDLLEYKERDVRARQAVLDQLIQDGVEQDMGHRCQ
ncbi:MAG TPA: excisionase family DNA-binding protein [Thermomicrobiales bacterium]|nr:excisionase family DNA-binding protein [Thermomicrobiales bacterium]